ncbi:hypothetical protein V6N12_069308 [Hibiscus sabdariffa]|uniref:Uncharacterized protein n=1 Tax=Hibiscus sabdariffa TaxID=183260 RepID=A0ABR2FDM9_9ROSI
MLRVGVEAFVEVNQSSLYGDDLKVVGITSDPLIPSEGVEPGSSIIGVDTRFPLKARTNVVAKPTVVEVMLSTKVATMPLSEMEGIVAIMVARNLDAIFLGG